MRRLGRGARRSIAPLRIVDVGTGSGAIAVALAVVAAPAPARPSAVEIVATDISADALGLARRTPWATPWRTGSRSSRPTCCPMAGSTADPFDLVLANLPYVRRDAMAGLPRATSFEPALALDGGADGLEVIGRLLDRLPGALADDGVALLEIGADQGEEIVCARRRAAARLAAARSRSDLAGLPRVARVGAAAERRAARERRSACGRASSRGAHRSRPPSPSCPSGWSPSTSTARSSATTSIIGPDTRAAIRARRRRGSSSASSPAGWSRVRSASPASSSSTRRSSATRARSSARCPPPGSTRPGRLLVHTPLRAEVAREVVVWSRTHGLDPHLNHLERFIVRADDPRADDYSAFMGSRAEPRGRPRRLHPPPDHEGHGRGRATIADRGRRRRSRRSSRAAPTSPSATRGSSSSSRRACRRVGRSAGWRGGSGIRLGAVLAIGDQWNDIEMIAEVGHGTAMPTAPAERAGGRPLRRAAAWPRRAWPG